MNRRFSTVSTALVILILYQLGVTWVGVADARPGSYGSSRTSGSASSRPSGGSGGGFGSSSGSSGASKVSGAPAKYGNTSGGQPATASGTAAATAGSQGAAGSPAGKYGNTANRAASSASSASSASAPAYGKPESASAFDNLVNKSISKDKARESLSRYEAGKSRYKPQASGGNAYTNTGGYRAYVPPDVARTYNPTTYAYRRDTFYHTTGYSAPSYSYNTYHSFGMWDGLFLWFMLDNITRPHYAQMYYNHQDDPGFQQWRQEAERLSRENAGLKDKLNNLDKEVSTLKGTPVDAKYVPPDVAPDVMMDKDALDAIKAKSSSMQEGAGRKTHHWFRYFLLGLIIVGLYLLVRQKRRNAPPPKYRL